MFKVTCGLSHSKWHQGAPTCISKSRQLPWCCTSGSFLCRVRQQFLIIQLSFKNKLDWSLPERCVPPGLLQDHLTWWDSLLTSFLILTSSLGEMLPAWISGGKWIPSSKRATLYHPTLQTYSSPGHFAQRIRFSFDQPWVWVSPGQAFICKMVDVSLGSSIKISGMCLPVLWGNPYPKLIDPIWIWWAHGQVSGKGYAVGVPQKNCTAVLL